MHKSIQELYQLFLQSKGISIDSRTINQGEIFFALSGENFDGSKFTDQAFQRGAMIAVVGNKKMKGMDKVIYVENPLFTLQKLAEFHRLQFNIPVIGLTGTNGKTTTKELIYNLLSSEFNTLCTQGNLNNHIGVPLTLLNIKKEHQIAVIEMGASARGEIMALCKIAHPTHGLITSIGKAHLEGFGSVENIIITKTELYQYIKENGGYFFLNTNVSDIIPVISISGFKNAESFNEKNLKGKRINSVVLDPSGLFISLNIIDIDGNENKFKTSVYGNYNFPNIVNAIKIADHFNISTDKIIKSLSGFVPSNNRSQMLIWKNNTLILDAYNANPTSVSEAISSFEKIDDKREKMIIIGDMLELGDTGDTEHKSVISRLLKNNIYKKIILVGDQFKNSAGKIHDLPENCHVFSTSELAGEFINTFNPEHLLILAKGSRGIKIETIFF
ncbi:MAG: UDP-N-acetylmuramoyl-tripeptide--D-alanyl-D-alanine ligase [Deltaproteobacteria bacterium]